MFKFLMGSVFDGEEFFDVTVDATLVRLLLDSRAHCH